MSGYVFQPKPEGYRYFTVHQAYIELTGDRTSAAILHVLELLAKKAVDPENGIPDSILIKGDCNFPLLNFYLLDTVKRSTARAKLNALAASGLISIEMSKDNNHRLVTYHRAVIARKLKELPTTPPKNSGGAPKTGTVPRQKIAGGAPKTSGDPRQKLAPTNTLTNSSYKEEELTGKESPKEYSGWGKESASSRVESRYKNTELPPWKTGRGRNAWNEEFIEHWIKTYGKKLESQGSMKQTRVDCITWLSRASVVEGREDIAYAIASEMQKGKESPEEQDTSKGFTPAASANSSVWAPAPLELLRKKGAA